MASSSDSPQKTPSVLSLLGGPPVVTVDPGDTFTWPRIEKDDEQAVLEVLRRGAMSDLDEVQAFEQAFAQWVGVSHALGFCNGTAALQAAMFACGVGAGDEIICPSITYWASALPAFGLQANVVFCDIDPVSLCADPDDIERRITSRTRAIMVVHYLGHPADMDRINAIAQTHGLRVIEDASHAHGGWYKHRRVGSLSDIAAFSLMSRKSLPCGEAGMLTTADCDLWERAVAFSHYARFDDRIRQAELTLLRGLPLGGVKGRMHGLSAALGQSQLKKNDAWTSEIREAIELFWSELEGVPGLRPHRVDSSDGSNMAGWYAARGHYLPEALGGLSAVTFARAVQAEGGMCAPGCNRPLHLHPVFNEADIYHHGQPTRLAHGGRDLRQPAGSLPVAEVVCSRTVKIPWFVRCRPAVIEQQAAVYRKVAEHADELLALDRAETDQAKQAGGWGLSR